MEYTSVDKEYIRDKADKSDSVHIQALSQMISNGSSYSELFEYGIKFLPSILNKTGQIDLTRLDQYTPVIVGYFDTLAELPSLPQKLKDLSIDLAVYANGESLQTDSYYLKLNPLQELKKALG